MSHQTGVTLAEVGFLLIVFAGVWLVAAKIPAFKIPTERTIAAGIALALAGVLLIITGVISAGHPDCARPAWRLVPTLHDRRTPLISKVPLFSRLADVAHSS